jgi:hypothetical protein
MGCRLPLLLAPLLLSLSCTGEITTREDGPKVTRRDRGPAGDGKVPEDDSQGVTCSPKGTFHNGYCYFTAGLGQMDYATAKPLCAAVAGAKPASIHNDDENQFIFKLLLSIRSGVWIGLVRESSTFKWEDGSPLSYENWASGEPDSDDCAILIGPFESQSLHGKWADTRCSRNYSEIACKFKP